MYKEDLALNNLQWLICHKTPSMKTHLTIKNKIVPRPKLRNKTNATFKDKKIPT